MFGSTKSDRIQQLTAELDKERAFNTELNEVNKSLIESFKCSCCLIGLRREGNKNIFTFVRDGKTFNIETYSTISDDWDNWCLLAGLNNGGGS